MKTDLAVFHWFDGLRSRPMSALRSGVVALSCMLAMALLSPPVSAQQRAPATAKQALGPQQSFPSAEAAFEAFVATVRGPDRSAMQKLLGPNYAQFIPIDEDDIDELRTKFLEAYGASHKVNMLGDAEAVLEVGTNGWTLPIPVVKGTEGWKFDVVAGADEIRDRAVGRNEIAVVQVLLAIVDAQKDYAEMDPMKTGTAQYARRLLSTPGKKDGLYWEQGPGDPESPLGDVLAQAQADGANREEGYFGYHYRLLYAQGAHAPGGARQFIVKDRMIGGFGVLAWPVRYGETGVATFIVNQDGVVYEKDLGPTTAAEAAKIQAYDPDKTWTKSDTSP